VVVGCLLLGLPSKTHSTIEQQREVIRVLYEINKTQDVAPAKTLERVGPKSWGETTIKWIGVS
jgi:hypothetical protein